MVAAPLSTRSHISTVSVTGPATVVAYCTIPAFPWRPGNTLKTHKSEFPEGLILQGTALWAQGRAPEALLSRLPALCPAHADTTLLFPLSPGHPHVLPHSRAVPLPPATRPCTPSRASPRVKVNTVSAPGSLCCRVPPCSPQPLSGFIPGRWSRAQAGPGPGLRCFQGKPSPLPTGSIHLPSAPPQHYLGDIGQLQRSDSACSNGQVLQHTE